MLNNRNFATFSCKNLVDNRNFAIFAMSNNKNQKK